MRAKKRRGWTLKKQRKVISHPFSTSIHTILSSFTFILFTHLQIIQFFNIFSSLLFVSSVTSHVKMFFENRKYFSAKEHIWGVKLPQFAKLFKKKNSKSVKNFPNKRKGGGSIPLSTALELPEFSLRYITIDLTLQWKIGKNLSSKEIPVRWSQS